jgi:hypothetical protein
VRIGLQQLGEIMTALGLPAVENTDRLLGGVLNIKVKVKDAQNGYEASNEVKGYSKVEGGMPTGGASGFRSPPPPADAKPAPWRRAPATMPADDIPF